MWTWDITYLKSPVRGEFFYLYMVLDIWSRKVVGWEVHAEENRAHSRRLLLEAYGREGVRPGSLVIHMDNGSPMKCATVRATLEKLGVTPSYSRPRVSDDNPFSESIFRTLKYRPEYPARGAFSSLESAECWVRRFVQWYNEYHLHSAIRFVTPAARHAGRDREILRRRAQLYARASAQRPERWRRHTRNWTPIKQVKLNPDERLLSNIA